MAIKDDITKIKAAIESLESGSEELRTDTLATLQQKLTDLEAQAAAEATALEIAAKNEGQQVKTKVKTWAEKFREKHGVSVWVAAVVGGYIVWQVGQAVARALGAI